MANRFTDTAKWDDPWFCGLSPAYKLFWNFLCDNCNYAGIWKVNWPLVKFHCWEDKFDVSSFGDRIIVLSDEKWFLKKFILFQQKIEDLSQLNALNIHHNSIIKILKAEGILSPLEAPAKGLDRGMSKSKSKSIIPNKDEGYGEKEKQDLFATIYARYPKKDSSKESWLAFNASVNNPKDWADINKALDNYLETKEVKDDYIKSAKNWFNGWRDFIENAVFNQDPAAKWRTEKR